MVHVTQGPDGLRVETGSYKLHFPADRPFAMLDDAAGNRWAELCLATSLHTVGGLDDTARLLPADAEADEAGARITVKAVSSVWQEKELVFLCREDHLQAFVRVKGSGAITDCHLFGGYYSGGLRFGSGFFLSGARFRSVFNPEPWGSERRAISASEPTLIDVGGSGALPGRRHWIFTPAPFCYALSQAPVAEAGTLRKASVGADQGGTPTELTQAAEATTGLAPAPAQPGTAPGARPAGAAELEAQLPPGPWLTLGLVTKPGEHLFTAFHYDGMEDGFSLHLAYEGQTLVDGAFESPAVAFRFGAQDPYEGLTRYVRFLEEQGLVDLSAQKGRPDWWSEPIVCGWGAQCHLGNLTKQRAPDLATQENYDKFMAALEAKGLKAGIVVIDDKWSATYGACEADTAKWPDLKGWIARRHSGGQKVLLWWKAWDAEGLPAQECVRNSAGLPITADPSNPAYEATLRKAVRLMLSAEGYNADGFKVDFSARTPSGPALTRHGREWGAELLHKLLWILRDEAKKVKPDALVMTHTPNPYFAAVTDMIRLNDVNTGSPVVAQMTHRARVARAACPNHLIDTDNWPMPGRAAWREYVRAQNDLGIPSLYFATDLDSMEPMEDSDYAMLREVWAEARAKGGR
jgi:hypothetical protein